MNPYQEPIAELSNATRDMHLALTSLMEELEAIDSYNPAAIDDPSAIPSDIPPMA